MSTTFFTGSVKPALHPVKPQPLMVNCYNCVYHQMRRSRPATTASTTSGTSRRGSTAARTCRLITPTTSHATMRSHDGWLLWFTVAPPADPARAAHPATCAAHVQHRVAIETAVWSWRVSLCSGVQYLCPAPSSGSHRLDVELLL